MKYPRPHLPHRQVSSAPSLSLRLPHARQLRAMTRLVLFAVLAVFARAQSEPATTPAAPAHAVVKSIRMVQEKDGPAVEIISSRPLKPAIQLLNNPPRLVIDLAPAVLQAAQKIKVGTNQIRALRADQFQANPPVTRVVVDLVAQRDYTWSAAGNRLLVHLGTNPVAEANSAPPPAPVSGLRKTPQPAAMVVQPGAPFALVGEGIMSGSSVTAGADTAIVRLGHGGEVHVCPGSTVSVMPAQNGRNLMLSINTGSFETHFDLDASSDSVMTPDFRILLTGPGEFDYAFSADNRGNTCVRALPGNTASAIVSELMGDRTYQVKATDQLVFRSGRLDQVDMNVPLECGCPPPRQSVMRAENNAPPKEDAPAVVKVDLGAKGGGVQGDVATVTTGGAPGAEAAPANGGVHVQVEAPMVFRAGDAPPAPIEQAQNLPLDARATQAPTLITPLPPPAPAPPQVASAKPPQHRGFFHKLGGFFSAMFR